jgi:cytochrome P450
MTNLFYRLATNPYHAKKVREEISSLTSIYDSQGLKGLTHMNGVINEVLRLHPSVIAKPHLKGCTSQGPISRAKRYLLLLVTP